MAKLSAPLFSFGARGKLGGALVYFPWKGINAVRTYVVPANPKSAGQQTQRTRLKNSVGFWHTIGLTALDVTAWDRFAATLPAIQSGFNAFVRDAIAVYKAALTPNMGFNATVQDDGDHTFTMKINEAGAATIVDLFWGESPTALINTQSCTEVTNLWTGSPATNVAGQTVYGRFRIKSAGGIIGWTGIYRQLVA